MRVNILTIKGWAILLAFLLFVCTMVFILNYLTSLLNADLELFGSLVTVTAYFLYPMVVGLRLRNILSSQPLYIKKSNASLIVDCLMIAMAVATSKVLPYQEKDLNILTVVIAVIGVVGFTRLGAFPAREIRSIELKRNAGIWEYASETFQMIYWPLAVLWMQPRVNKIANKKAITISE